MKERKLKKDGQNARILEHLQNGGFVTPLFALREWGCFRLSGRVFDLKKRGYNIVAEIVNDTATGKRYAKYYIPQTQR